MEQDHRPWDIKRLGRGVNSDQDAKGIANTDGVVRDAQNMRFADDNGNTGDGVKIGGEQQIHGDLGVPGASTYWPNASIEVLQRTFEIWSSDQPALYPPLIRLDGIVVVQHPSLPYVFDKPVQLHKTEDCEGGIVFDARSGGIPIHWPIADILRAYNAQEQTYFSGFDITSVQVTPTRPINRPVFTGFVPVGQGNGLSGGLLFYYVRLVNNTGDRSSNGPKVGPIPLPYEQRDGWINGEQRPLPHADLAGITPLQVGVPTGYGVGLRVRINNRANFQSAELVRVAFNENGGPDALPSEKICLRWEIQPGENTVYPIIDQGGEIEPIPTDESLVQTHFIKEANSVRYINFRVVYGGVNLGPRDITGNWLNAGETFPVTKSIGIDGHADPIKACYQRSFKRGERINVGAVYWDDIGAPSYVDRIGQNVTLPNRRDEKTGDSLVNSSHPIFAATVDHEVRPTFEVFDLDNAISKERTEQVINIMDGARRVIGNSPAFVNQALTGVPNTAAGTFNDGAFVDWNGPHLRTNYTKKLPPQLGDDSKWGHNYKVNTRVLTSGAPGTTNGEPYSPKVYAPRQHSLALAVRGLATPPPGTQGVSIVVARAKRVVAQGIAKWKLSPGQHPNFADNQNRATKDQYQLHVCFPEYGAGGMSQQTWEGILAADGRYGLQLVSPLGITTEQFGSVMAQRPTVDGAYSALSDLLSVARVLWDKGQCNPGNNSGGYSPEFPIPGNPDHFTGYDSWRNSPRPNSPFHAGNNGNRIFQYNLATEVVHDSGQRSMILNVNAPIYGTVSCPSSDFASDQAKAFHEPWYVINIVQDGVRVDDREGYEWCNHYIPFVSHIGNTNGQAGQEFQLADERLEDVWSTVDGQERYIWLITPNGVQPYLFIGTFWGSYSAIQDSLNTTGSWTTPSGLVIYGLYDVQFGSTTQIASVQIISQAPPSGYRVEVRYNNAVPIAVYGDQIIAPSFGTIVDAAASANPQNTVPSNGWTFTGGLRRPVYQPNWFSGNYFITGGLPIPFANYEYNGNYLVPFGLGFGTGNDSPAFAINQHSAGMIVSLRQWKVLFDCEVSTQLYMAQNAQPTNITYPFVNYQQRPYNFLPNNSLTGNGIAVGYSSHYLDGPAEWIYGGLKSRVLPIADYSRGLGAEFFRIGDFGIAEKTKQCAAVIWSRKSPPVTQDLPGLKTFPVLNIAYIEPTRGSVQRLYSQAVMGGTGYNLYAAMERGIRLLLVEQNISRSASGEADMLFQSDDFIAGQLWIPGDVGMPGDSWMTAAEATIVAPGGMSRTEALGWSDLKSYFLLSGNSVVDVGDGQYKNGIKKVFGGYTNVRGTRLSGAYDRNRDEFYFATSEKVVVFAAGKNTFFFNGTYTYRFQNYVFSNGRMLGLRNLTTSELNSGDLINGQLVNAWVKIPSSPSEYAGQRMQWHYFKVDSARKPKRVEFFDEDDQLVCWLDADRVQQWGFPPSSYLRKVTVWENQIPRIHEAINPSKLKLQGTLAYYKIIFEDAGPDTISMAGVQPFKLK